MSARSGFLIAGILGFTGVALGAFGAHGLKDLVAAERMAWWHTGVQYHLVHALLAVTLARLDGTRAPLWCCVAGTVLFSGSLYAMTLTGITRLGMITPLGGLAFLAAWALVALRARAPST